MTRDAMAQDDKLLVLRIENALHYLLEWEIISEREYTRMHKALGDRLCDDK